MPDFSFKAAGAISQFIGFGDYIQGTKEYDFWVKKYYQCMDDHLAVEKKVFSMLLAKCSDGSFKLNEIFIERFNQYLNICKENASIMEEEFGKLLMAYRNQLLSDFVRNSALNIATLGLKWEITQNIQWETR